MFYEKTDFERQVRIEWETIKYMLAFLAALLWGVKCEDPQEEAWMRVREIRQRRYRREAYNRDSTRGTYSHSHTMSTAASHATRQQGFSKYTYTKHAHTPTPEPTIAPSECQNPNTVLTLGNGCVCAAGFPYGDPYDAKGCWACSTKCHKSAYCQWPGECRCKDPLEGDGVKTCHSPQIRIISINPDSGSVYGGNAISVFYNTSARTRATSAFCRFGAAVIESTLYNEKYVTCKAPAGSLGSVGLAISLDGTTWSKDVTYSYTSAERSPIFILMFPVTLVIAVMLFVYIRSRIRRNKKLGEEDVPFLASGHSM